MNEPLENLYFNWLCAKVSYVRNPTPSLTYDNLFRTLHTTEFVWLLSGDDNRSEDGKDLRTEFLIAGDLPDEPEWRTQVPCSVFEMLLAFSRRAEFQTDTPSHEWFWEMVDNLNLKGVTDAAGVSAEEIRETLDLFMWRQYSENGDGGLFPLKNPQRNQAQVEIWDQFCDYMVDQDRLL